MSESIALLSCESAARALGVTAPTVSRLFRSGAIETISDGRRRYATSEGLRRYLSDNNLVEAPEDHAAASTDGRGPVAISFFSGALGLDLGMERAGIKARLYCESDRKCRMTIQANRPDAALVGDITDVTASDVRELAGLADRQQVDVVFGGPPCQAFSTAGARRAFDDRRGNVFLRYLDLVRDLSPTYVVIENVRGLLSTPWPISKGGAPVRGGAMKHVLDTLDAYGYTVSFNLYNAANFGAPQIRERVILIGKRGGRVPWLTPTNDEFGRYGLKPWVTFGDATSDIQGKPMHHAEFPEKRLRFLRMLREGQCWKDLPTDVVEEAMGKSYRLAGGKTGFYRRIRFDRPCPTLVTSPTMPATDLCHPTEDRPLSVEEYKRVQGFPDGWRICGNLQDQYRQIGNAVPISLGTAVGRAIVADMQGCASPSPSGFAYSRYKCTSDQTWHVG